ncbi:M48 family metalloprotease [[Actinomadura] parvosata]|uniref:M48 family metalloprotease n=1 Tax=[Actinomadura] parvosata TaxID=1955412 RepID=UPI00406C20D4
MRRLANTLKTTALRGLPASIVLTPDYWIGGQAGLFAPPPSLNVATCSFSDRLALRDAGRPLNHTEAPGVHAMAADLAATAGQPTPRLYESPVRRPNAFATGWCPRQAAACATEGLLDLLIPRELRAALGQEPAHIHNRDILLSSVAGTLAGGLTMLAATSWTYRKSTTEV